MICLHDVLADEAAREASRAEHHHVVLLHASVSLRCAHSTVEHTTYTQADQFSVSNMFQVYERQLHAATQRCGDLQDANQGLAID